MIFTLIVVGLFVFKAPEYTWLSVPICLVYFFLKSLVKRGAAHTKNDVPETEFDEFDLWQDNQDL